MGVPILKQSSTYSIGLRLSKCEIMFRVRVLNIGEIQLWEQGGNEEPMGMQLTGWGGGGNSTNSLICMYTHDIYVYSERQQTHIHFHICMHNSECVYVCIHTCIFHSWDG